VKALYHLVLLSRGRTVLTAIEGPVGDVEQTKARIDLLRALVPTNALFGLGAMCCVLLGLTRRVETWDVRVLLVLFSWWALSSGVVFLGARVALKKLE
jgi:hypothetical protein